MANKDDISEIFRRAFEESERRRGSSGKEEGEGGGDNEPPQRPQRRPQMPNIPRPSLPSWFGSRRMWVLLALFFLLTGFGRIVTFYTDWLWFTNIGYADVWLKQWGFRLVAFAAGFVIAAAVLVTNVRLALRGAVNNNSSRFKPGEYRAFKSFVTAIALLFSVMFALTMASRWEMFLRYLNQSAWGTNDPIFGRDISFYIFSLPVYRFLQGWLIPLFMFSIIAIVGLYAMHHIEEIRSGRWQPQSLTPLRRHVAILAAITALLVAVGYWLSRYELLYSTQGLVLGAGYTDLKITAPVLMVNGILMLILAAALLLNTVRFNLRPLIAAGALWLLSVVILGGIVPGLVQRYSVEPNEKDLEKPYLQHNIDFTRLAFGLDNLIQSDFGSVDELSAEDLAQNQAALANIRLWDYRVLPSNYEQLQALRPYYQFGDVDIDRYLIDGEYRQVMLSGRELKKSELGSNSWINQKLEFTHGYGVVMNPVDRFTRNGQPDFFISDLPPKSTVEGLEVTRPEIYYGEMMTDEVFVASARDEFDYPSGDENARTRYEGNGGVEMSSFLRRLALAIRFGDINVLLSSDITDTTRAIFRRQISERVKTITPFLTLDSDPYLVIAEGRMVWMMDAYTSSNRFPYSEAVRFNGNQRVNYVRNSVKIVIDAYTGDVTYYLVDEDDPIIKSYAAAFPDLFKPLSEIPEALKAHIRYPETLFLAQTQQYLKYHMSDVGVFYNQEDLWAIPQETFNSGSQQPMEPYYVIFSLPDETETEYLLIQPYTPVGKKNMIAWLAARNDGEHYGELRVYTLPKQELVFGPIQVEGRIDQEPEISQQLSLWNQLGSKVIRGNLIVIPINNSFLYVEPLYLQSETSALPELKRVIVASGNRIAMSDTLAGALADLLDDPATAVVDDGADTAPSTDTGQTVTPPISTEDSSLIEQANDHYIRALEAQKTGDWATYGEELEILGAILEQLSAEE